MPLLYLLFHRNCTSIRFILEKTPMKTHAPSLLATEQNKPQTRGMCLSKLRSSHVISATANPAKTVRRPREIPAATSTTICTHLPVPSRRQRSKSAPRSPFECKPADSKAIARRARAAGSPRNFPRRRRAPRGRRSRIDRAARRSGDVQGAERRP